MVLGPTDNMVWRVIRGQSNLKLTLMRNILQYGLDPPHKVMSPRAALPLTHGQLSLIPCPLPMHLTVVKRGILPRWPRP